MLILFDHGTPRGLHRAFSEHTVITAQSRGWDRLNNGALLNVAEEAGVDVLLSTDQGIRYQQNLAHRKIALVVLTGAIKWSRVRLYGDRIAACSIGIKRGVAFRQPPNDYAQASTPPSNSSRILSKSWQSQEDAHWAHPRLKSCYELVS